MSITIYNNIELVNQIKTIFTNDDIKIFDFNYMLYKQYKGKEEDFIMDFEQVYKFIGFTRKDHAKRLLLKHFIENIDYKMNKTIAPPLGGAKTDNRGGVNKEQILVNLNTYKRYCLFSATEYSKKIYNYYIKMEKIMRKQY